MECFVRISRRQLGRSASHKDGCEGDYRLPCWLANHGRFSILTNVTKQPKWPWFEVVKTSGNRRRKVKTYFQMDLFTKKCRLTAAEVKCCRELYPLFIFYNTDSFLCFSLAVWVFLVEKCFVSYIFDNKWMVSWWEIEHYIPFQLVLGGVCMEKGQPSLPRSRISVKFFVKICCRLYEKRASPPWQDLAIDYRDLA